MNEDIRETIHSMEYDEYYASLDEKTKAKYDFVEMIIKTQYVVNRSVSIYHRLSKGRQTCNFLRSCLLQMRWDCDSLWL